MSDKVRAVDVEEGDKVFLGINLWGTSDGLPGVEYRRDIYQAGATGTVVDAPSELAREALRDGGRPMTDFAVETPDGTVYRWNVDNGYVIGPVDEPGRPDRSDVGKFAGFYEP